MIPGSANPLLLASAAAAGDYQVSRSLRFNSSDSAYLSRTPAVAGDRRTWTWAGWVKRSVLSVSQQLFNSDGGITDITFGQIVFLANDRLRVAAYNLDWRDTSAVFRDVSAWYHIVVAFDTTQTTASNRVKIYVNGVQLTDFATTNDPSLNTDYAINQVAAHNIGRTYSSYSYFSGYLADIHFIDGQALAPSSFTEVSATTGQLIPLAYTGTYGTNGFQLKFADNSAATAATLGADTSGNGNNWTPNNFSVSTSAINYSNNNQVTGSYTSGWTTGYGPEKMFDGNLATYTDQVDTGPGGAVAYLYWSPSPTIGVNSLRIYGSWYKAGQNPYVDYDQVSINGNPYVGNAGATATFAWWDLTSYLTTYSITTITNITFQRTPIGGNRVDPNIAAVEVNGSILINAAPADNDSLVDTPTSYGTPDTGVGGEVRGNYATFNPIEKAAVGGAATLANGNLDMQGGATEQFRAATIPVSSGKWYFEIVQSAGSDFGPGVWSYPLTSPSSQFYQNTNYRYNSSGGVYTAAGLLISYSSFTTGDIIGTALDLDNGKVYF